MTQPLTVLLTNIILNGRSGTEVQTRNIAIELLQQGHKPVVYSPALGPIASELRAASIPVVSDLNRIEQSIDIVHGHHLSTTVAALARFAQTPAIFVCHDFVAWHDAPPLLPAIRRYVAVDDTVYDRLTLEGGVAPQQVQVLLNAVDTNRFLPGPPLPTRPRRALAFAKNTGHIDAIKAACDKRGIHLDLVGQALGRTTSTPETLVADYDLVFTSALSAMEAMASGRAVLVCDGRGLAGLCDPARFVSWRRLNFGLRTLRPTLTEKAIGAEIDRYDAAQAAEVSAMVRAEGGMAAYVEQLTGLYRNVLREHQQAPHSAAALCRSMATHLQDWYPDANGGSPWLRERELLMHQIDELSFGATRSPLDTAMAFTSTQTQRWWHAIRGFSAPEPFGTWTEGSTAMALIRVESQVDMQAEFQVIPYLPDPDREIQVDVTVNGLMQVSWFFYGPVDFATQERVLPIPGECVGEDGAIWLVFHIRHARSPHQLGRSADTRVLGLAFHSLTIRAARMP